MKIKKNKNINLIFEIKELEKITNKNIFQIINVLSERSNIIKYQFNINIKKILLLLKIKNYKYNKKKIIFLKKKLDKINNYPITTYLAIIELLNKELIIIN
ncbi:MAG: hypothetical protein NHG00_00770 [Candidatus Shikimatogenerans sp. JK-2022]|nr:hypothetical protein [Candidatus Shikimatogenerans bostrichidophilus]